MTCLDWEIGRHAECVSPRYVSIFVRYLHDVLFSESASWVFE